MIISINLTETKSRDPMSEYSPKITTTLVDVEGMDADPQVIAATLRGLADRIAPRNTHGQWTTNVIGGSVNP